MADQDLIQRLLGVERQAESLVKEAEKEAERRKSVAREAENRKFQEEITRRNHELENLFQSNVQRFRKEREEKLKTFIEDLHNTRRNPERLRNTLDEIIKKGIL